jgi:hypothetical protein
MHALISLCSPDALLRTLMDCVIVHMSDKYCRLACVQEEDDEDVFDVDKHVVRGMVVLLRTKEESGSGWRHPWSVARVNRCRPHPQPSPEERQT